MCPNGPRSFVELLNAMMTTPATPAETADRTIITTRLLNAPRERVFRAFSEPERLARWWGPKGFTNTFHEFDFKAGGHWRFVMRGPDGTEYENHSVFLEVREPERIVFRHLDPVHEFEMTITLVEEAGKTRLTWHMLHSTVAKSEAVRAFVTEANEQNFDRLEAELAKMLSTTSARPRLGFLIF
jgi:uncharacterized protein YndB with AHSA1/START domain